MKIKGNNGTYEVGDIIADNKEIRTRRCVGHRLDGTEDRELLCQIAVDSSKNAGLARNALMLTQLAEASDRVEAEYASNGGMIPLNYSIAFPELVDSFVLLEQGARQINILGFRHVNELHRLVPLVKLWKQGLRVDLRTSAWIMGKLLKIIAFAHNNSVEVSDISGNNVLIEPDQHYVFVFNWASAVTHDDQVPSTIIRNEIKRAAKVVIRALGEDLDKACPAEVDLPYVNYLYYLATNGESDAFKAHKTFYDVVDALCENPDSEWEPGFYKFTTLPL